MPEIAFVRGLLGSPQLAIEATAGVSTAHFEDRTAQIIFDAIGECLAEGELPAPRRVADLVLGRVPDFALDIQRAGRVITRTALLELAAQVALRGTKRLMARGLAQFNEHLQTVIECDEISTAELQATLNRTMAAAQALSAAPIRSIADVAEEVVEATQARFDGQAETLVWDIGIHRIDRRICAAPGKVTVIGADSGHGKTSFVSWYLAQQLRQFVGLGCLYLPLADMSMQEIAGRRLAGVSGQNSNKLLLRAPDSTEDMLEVRAALKRLQGSYGNRFLIGTPGKTMPEIESDIRRGCLLLQQQALRPGTVVIDYAQVVKTTDKLNRFERLAVLAEAAKAWADELQIHIIITSQLNSEPGKAKPGEGRAPRVNDIWGGKEMEWFSASMLILIRKGRKQAQPLRDFNGSKIPKSSPHYEPIPDALQAVYEVELWGLKGRFGHDEYPAGLDYLAPVCVYEEPGSGRLKRWNTKSAQSSAQMGIPAAGSKPPSAWGTP